MLRDACRNEQETMVVGRNIVHFERIDSTNTYLKRAALDGAAEGTVVIADAQTAGRGRLDRLFQSPVGKGLYLSVLLRPDLPPERLLSVTALAGVAACNAVERVCGVRPGMKWPNDLVLENRKLAGILTELVVLENGRLCVVIGIGINISQAAEDFSPDVAEIATSLQMALKHPVSREQLATTLIAELDRMYEALLQDCLLPYLTAYRQSCVNLGKTVQLIHPDGSREVAEAESIDEMFGLVVRTAGGMRTVRSGEVSVRGLYGYLE